MADVVNIKKNKIISKSAIKLVNFGNAIDDLITAQLKDADSFTAEELAVVIGHRIGELLKRSEDKEAAIYTVIETMKARAGVE